MSGASTEPAKRKQIQSCFQLNVLIVADVEVIVNHFIDLFECLKLLSINVLGFQNAKKIYSQRIVIAIFMSWYRWCNAVFLSYVEICLQDVLKCLVTVDLQFSATSSFYRSHRKMNGIQYKINHLANTPVL